MNKLILLVGLSLLSVLGGVAAHASSENEIEDVMHDIRYELRKGVASESQLSEAKQLLLSALEVLRSGSADTGESVQACTTAFPYSTEDRLQCISHGKPSDVVSECSSAFPYSTSSKLDCVGAANSGAVVRACKSAFPYSDSDRLKCAGN